MTHVEGAVRRIRTRAIGIGAILSAGAFLVGWQAGISLTICAAVVIFSFLVFERLAERLADPPAAGGGRKDLPLLLVTGAAVALLVFVLRWGAFNLVAGLVGLSAVVLAIVGEVFERGREG